MTTTITGTLKDIRTKVRRLTASPSEFQLKEDDIDNYVNTFYLNDLPAHLKLFCLKETYTFYTEQNVDTYALPVNPSFTDATQRAYYSLEPPVYVSGYRALYTQSREEFYRLYPSVSNEQSTAGTAITGPYAITITNTPILTGSVVVSAVDNTGITRIGFDDGVGGFTSVNTGDITAGTINYATGAITGLTFGGTIPVTEDIVVQSFAYNASRSSAVLFYNNELILRPIPDKAYRVEIDASIYPTVLLSSTNSPETQTLWQLLAVGAAKKVFEDRADFDSIKSLMPLFDEQMRLCERKTLQQNRPIRAATIYSNQVEFSGNFQYNKF